MADPKLSAIGSFSVGAETTFGVAATYMDHMRVASIDISGLERVTLANDFTRQGDYETQRLLGGSKGSITTRHRLHGFSSSIPSAAVSLTDVTQNAATSFDQLVSILGSAFGQAYAGGYAPSQALDLTVGQEMSTAVLDFLRVGQPLAWETGGTRPAYEVTWITGFTSGTPDTATLLQQPRNNSEPTSELWGGYTAFVRDLSPFHDNGNCKSWTLQWLGGATTDNYTMYGCQPTNVKMTFAVNQVPMLEITWGVAHWDVPGIGSGPPAVQTWSYPEPEPCLNWQIAIGGASVVYPVTKEVSFDLGLTRVALEGGHSDSGVEGWLATMRRPKLTLSVLWDDAWHTMFADQTPLPVTVQVGSQPGRIIALCMPAARLVSLPKRGDRDGATVMDLEFEAHYYDSDTSSDAVATYPRDSLCRVAFL